MNSNSIINISHLIDFGLNDFINFENHLLVSHVRDLSLFQQPCHLKAVTFVLCLNGVMEGFINLKKYRLEKYSALINFSDNIIQITHTENLNAYAVIISTDYLQSLSLDTLSHSHYYIYEIKRNETFTLPQAEVKNLANYLPLLKAALHKDSEGLNPTKRELIKHIISSFVVNMLVLHNKYHIEEEHSVCNISKSKYIMMDKFIELLKIYHTEERELQFYADKMNITPKYLSNLVRTVTGRKATEWISDYVILEAKSHLVYSGKNIQEISHRLNFPTQSAFGKYFKAQVGMTPTEYMEKNQIFG